VAVSLIVVSCEGLPPDRQELPPVVDRTSR
jgi:hypothetical protein